MPISEAGHSTTRPDASSGFTLLEIIVVLAIVSILLTIGGLALPDTASSRLELAAARLVETIHSCQRGAVLSGVPSGLVVEADGYAMWHYRGRWLASARATEAPHRLAAGVEIEGAENSTTPQIICLPDSDTRFTPLRVLHRSHDAYYEVDYDEAGVIVARQVDPNP